VIPAFYPWFSGKTKPAIKTIKH